jgi:hypothetical protein
MVRDGKVLLVDAFFVQVRPSPWRQAVDLGNMMLVLAVGSDPERVYRHALRYFTPAEVAEAFAATRGVASPTQLRAVMKRDGRDLLDQFRRLAPERRPIAIQRWSVKRVALVVGLVVSAALVVGFTYGMLTPFRGIDVPDAPACTPQATTVLAAQAVPGATLIPCVSALPAGWQFDGGDVRAGRAKFRLITDLPGHPVVTLTLAGSCDTSTAHPVATDEPGTQRFDADTTRSEPGRPDRLYTFPGGCVGYHYSPAGAAEPDLQTQLGPVLTFIARDRVATYVREQSDLTLCGAGTSCPG